MHPVPLAGINWDALVHSTQDHTLPAGSQGTREHPRSGAACGSHVPGARMGPKAPNSAGATPAGDVGTLRFRSRVPNPGGLP